MKYKHSKMIGMVFTIALALVQFDAYAAQVEAPYMTAIRYNPAGQITGTIAPDPDGGGSLRLLATRNTYTNGLLTKVESGELGVWQDETVDPSTWSGFTVFSTTVIGYDTVGRKIQETMIGRNGSTVESLVEYSYDTAGHLWCKAVRLSKTASGNACAQGTQSSDGPDRIYRYTYDGLDQVLTEEHGVGTSLSEIYVTNTYSGRKLATQADANGNLTQLTYDSYGRLQYRYYPSPTATGSVNSNDYNFYTYDANGNVQTERKRNNTTITYSYDAGNHVTSKVLSDHTYSQDVYYAYDARGLMRYSLYGNDSGAGINTTYDGFGHVYTSTNTMGGVSRTLSYQYDNNGNRTRVTHPDGIYFQYGFDGLNRLNRLCESVTSCPDGNSALLVTVGYRAEGIPYYISRGNNASVTSIPLQTNTPPGLDNANRVATLFHDFTGTVNDLTETFSYNAANQVTQLTMDNTAYSYVGNSNKTGAYVVNGLNQYTGINGTTVSYDANGNETSDGTNTYSYDMENHLVATGGGVTSSFVYDPRGRLFQSTINGSTTQFLYDGDALVAEYILSGATFIQTRRYVHGDQVDQPLVQYNGSIISPTARIYLTADHQGSIIAESDNSGNVQAKFAYENFGAPKSNSYDRFGYTGQAYFKELGLNYYKARWYSPTQGRFMQTDPIFYKDDMDLYSYVGNDPMDRSDPTGTKGDACFAMTSGIGSVCAGPAIGDSAESSLSQVRAASRNVQEMQKVVDAVGEAGKEVGTDAALIGMTFFAPEGWLGRALVALGWARKATTVAEATTTLYRAVDTAEAAQALKMQKFLSGPNSLGGKWFATTAENASKWGKSFYGSQPFAILEVRVPTSSVDQMMRVEKLDGIGAAVYGELDQLNNAVIKVFSK